MTHIAKAWEVAKVLDFVAKIFTWGFGFLYLSLLFLALVLTFVLTRRYFENKNHQNNEESDFIITRRPPK